MLNAMPLLLLTSWYWEICNVNINIVFQIANGVKFSGIIIHMLCHLFVANCLPILTVDFKRYFISIRLN